MWWRAVRNLDQNTFTHLHSNRGGKHANRSHAAHFRWRGGGDCLELSARERTSENNIPSRGPLPLKKQPLSKNPSRSSVMEVMQQLRREAGKNNDQNRKTTKKKNSAVRKRKKKDRLFFPLLLLLLPRPSGMRSRDGSANSVKKFGVAVAPSLQSLTDCCCSTSPPVGLSVGSTLPASACLTPFFPLVLRGSQ